MKFWIFVAATALQAFSVQVLAQGTGSATLSPQDEMVQLVVRAKIFEKGTRKPLSDTNVFLLPLKIKATTSTSGEAVFGPLPFSKSAKAELQIVVNLAGYRKFEETFTANLQMSQLDLGNLYVEKIKYSGFETVIIGKAESRDDQERVLKRDDFLLAPGANRDPVKAVQNLPGVNRPSGFSSQIIVQGSEPEDTRYNLEGHEIPLIFHFGGLASVLYPDSIDSVSLLGAGYGPEFGDALGGHVGLKTKRPRRDRWGGQAFVDIFNIGAMAEGPVSTEGSLLASARYSYIGTVLKKVADGQDSFGLTAAPSFADASVFYEDKLSEKDSIKVIALASQDQVEIVVKDAINNDPGLRGRFANNTNFYRLITAWKRDLNADDSLSASVGIGRDQILADIGTNFFRLNTNRLTTRGEYVTRWGSQEKRLKSYFGWDNDYNWFDIGIRIPSSKGGGGVGTPLSVGTKREADLSDRVSLTGIYTRHEWKVTEKLTLVPGLRVARNSVTKEILPEPRFSVRYEPDQGTQYRFATGLYNQAPAGQETDRSFGNPDIRSSRAVHFNVGWERDFRAGASTGNVISVGSFYKNLSNLVVPSAALVSRDGVTQTENFNNNGEGSIVGAEVSWKTYFSEWILGANYTLSQSRRSQPGRAEFPSAFDQTHNLNLLASYNTERWQWTGRLRYVTGSPLTPVVSGAFDADQDVYVPIRGAFYSDRKADFFQVDVRGEYKWVYEQWILAAYVDVQNILNVKNVENVDYSYDYSQRQDVMGLGVLPTIGVRGEF